MRDERPRSMTLIKRRSVEQPPASKSAIASIPHYWYILKATPQCPYSTFVKCEPSCSLGFHCLAALCVACRVGSH